MEALERYDDRSAIAFETLDFNFWGTLDSDAVSYAA